MKRSRHELVPSLLLFSIVAGCSDLSGPTVPCQGDDWGEYPPTACGVLSTDATNVPPGWVVAVIAPGRNEYPTFFYWSGRPEVGAVGQFQLLVERFGGGTAPDTATLTLGAFASADRLTDPQWPPPDMAVDVLVQFAPIGSRVDTTYTGALTFH